MLQTDKQNFQLEPEFGNKHQVGSDGNILFG